MKQHLQRIKSLKTQKVRQINNKTDINDNTHDTTTVIDTAHDTTSDNTNKKINNKCNK